MYFGNFDVAPIQVDFGKIAPTQNKTKETKNEKNKMKQTHKLRDSQRLYHFCQKKSHLHVSHLKVMTIF